MLSRRANVPIEDAADHGQHANIETTRRHYVGANIETTERVIKRRVAFRKRQQKTANKA